MNRYHLTAASAALAVASQLVSGSAFAHIELQSPLNRYSDIKSGDNKSCPCGSGTTNRSCRKPEELSDPDRSPDRATTFAPGDEITVRFDEYVGHSGRYRIAFDPDGADLDDFNQNILMDVPDPTGKVGNMGQGSLWEFQVTLPDVTCENCTLQLIQVMDGNTTDPVPDPVLRGGTYFQCADIILEDGTPAGGIPPASPTEHVGQRGRPNPAVAVTMETPSSTSSGTGVTATSGMASNGTGTMGSSTATGADVTPEMMGSSGDAGGCSVAGARSTNAWSTVGALGSVLLTSGLLARRRQRRRAKTQQHVIHPPTAAVHESVLVD